VRVPGGPAGLGVGPFRCMAANCSKVFPKLAELRQHYWEMGVPGFEEAPASEESPLPAPADDPMRAHLGEETGPAPALDPAVAGGDLSRCSVCMDRPPDVVMVPCGHIYACRACGEKLLECALCRTPVTQVLRVYYSADGTL
jgi:hypothetical protein